MGAKRKIEQLEKRVKYLEQVLLFSEKIIEQYIMENKESLPIDHRYSTDSAMEDIYSFIKSVGNRIKKLENKEN